MSVISYYVISSILTYYPLHYTLLTTDVFGIAAEFVEYVNVPFNKTMDDKSEVLDWQKLQMGCFLCLRSSAKVYGAFCEFHKQEEKL